MANKRFIKKDLDGNVLTPELIAAKAAANAAVHKALEAERDKMAINEYRYCLAEARRQHPDWTLKQRQEYAQRSAAALFE